MVEEPFFVRMLLRRGVLYWRCTRTLRWLWTAWIRFPSGELVRVDSHRVIDGRTFANHKTAKIFAEQWLEENVPSDASIYGRDD